MTTGGDEVRRRIGKGDPTDFYLLDGLKSEGHTDYVALVHRFASDGVIGEMDCVYSHWTTRKADGFSEEDCAALRRLVPALALASKSASLARIAGTLVEVYLGRDAGEHVLRGRMSRGVAERIHAVLWFSDLRRRIHELNERRRSESRPISSVRLGLHLGDVLFGNIGSDTRLDFTVVGPTVNEVNRIVAMCRSVDRDVLASADFVAALPAAESARFVSVGRFALRGVRRAQELFTLDPDRPSAGGPRAATNRR